jgi:hypothetical protein
MGAIAQQRCIKLSAIVQHNLGVEDDQSNKVFEDAVGQWDCGHNIFCLFDTAH